ncbi:hypothetical protein KI387_022193, partial [Taxus chinensis]
MGSKGLERELVEVFEKVKKAADRAADCKGAARAEEERCLDALKALDRVPVNFSILSSTGVGKKLRAISRHPREAIRTASKELLDAWKTIVASEINADNKENRACNSQGREPTKTPPKFGDKISSEDKRSQDRSPCKDNRSEEKRCLEYQNFKFVETEKVEHSKVTIEKKHNVEEDGIPKFHMIGLSRTKVENEIKGGHEMSKNIKTEREESLKDKDEKKHNVDEIPKKYDERAESSKVRVNNRCKAEDPILPKYESIDFSKSKVDKKCTKAVEDKDRISKYEKVESSKIKIDKKCKVEEERLSNVQRVEPSKVRMLEKKQTSKENDMVNFVKISEGAGGNRSLMGSTDRSFMQRPLTDKSCMQTPFMGLTERSKVGEKPIVNNESRSDAPINYAKCNDPARDKYREIIAIALNKVYNEAKEEDLEKANKCDPGRVAVAVETALFQKLDNKNGPQKMKYRSIYFNINDDRNPDFRRKVLLGEIEPERLPNISTDEMASDEMLLKRQMIKNKALFDSERGISQSATTDQFKCGKCGQRRTTYHQMQTRSADEPMTTF